MKITIAIPTYNRPYWLLQTARQVIQQNHAAVCEIIIVDQTPWNNIDSNLQSQLNELISSTPLIQYIPVKNPNLPAARNIALSKAIGEIVLFMDDDVLLPDSFIDSHYQCYLQKEKAVMAVAGLPFHRKQSVDEKLITLENFKSYCRPHFLEESMVWDWNKYMVGANFSVLKNNALGVHGFDENFIGPAAYEDKDFSLRLIKEYPDKNICFNPQAYLIHYKATSGGCRIEAKNNWSEFETLFSSFIYGWRHLSFQKLPAHFWQMLRRGPLRKENIVKPWRQLLAWPVLVWTFFYSLLFKHRIKSSID